MIQTTRLSEIKVLVVDDDNDDLFLIGESILESIKEPIPKIDKTNSVKTASELIKKNNYDILVLDYDLGEITGIDFLKDFRQSGHDTPVIFISSADDLNIQTKAIEAGANDYLIKGTLSYKTIGISIIHTLEVVRKNSNQSTQSSFFDPTTNLHNKESFFKLAEIHLKAAFRENKQMTMFRIHTNTDNEEALHEITKVVKDIFNDSDVSAYMGTGQFTVLASNSLERVTLKTRLKTNLKLLSSQLDENTVIKYGYYDFLPKTNSLVSEILNQAQNNLESRLRNPFVRAAGRTL